MNKSLTPTELKRLHRTWRKRTTLQLSLILDGVQNPFNIGALLRSAAAYKVEHIWVVPPTHPVSHPKIAKTALGSEKLVTVSEAESGPKAIAAAKAAGFHTVAIELTSKAKPLFEIECPKAICLILGHEERGVHKDTLATADDIGFLPQLGKIGSLNVAHAGTVAFYEVARQNWT